MMSIFKIYCLSNFSIYTLVLVTKVKVLYIISPRLLLKLEVCTCLPPSHHFSQHPNPQPLAATNLYLRVYFLDSTHK